MYFSWGVPQACLPCLRLFSCLPHPPFNKYFWLISVSRKINCPLDFLTASCNTDYTIAAKFQTDVLWFLKQIFPYWLSSTHKTYLSECSALLDGEHSSSVLCIIMFILCILQIIWNICNITARYHQIVSFLRKVLVSNILVFTFNLHLVNCLQFKY